MTFFMPSSRTLRDGQMIQEKTTVSSSLRLTAIGNEVTFPSGVGALIHKLDAVGRTDAVAHAARRGVIHL